MADIILLDGRGEPATYSGITVVEFDTPSGGRAQFIGGDPVSKEVDADFADGNLIIQRADGELLDEVVVRKPETLTPENIVAGATVAGIEGIAPTGELVEKTVSLDFSEGNQVINRTEGEIIDQLTIEKPEALVPENISAGVDIAGVVGTAAGAKPSVGFVPTAWSEDGTIIAGEWYGETVPGSYFQIYGSSYMKCANLRSVSFAEGLKTISGSAFYGQYDLVVQDLPQTVRYIGSYAFNGVTLPETLVLPELNLANMPDYAFGNTKGVKSVWFGGCEYDVSKSGVPGHRWGLSSETEIEFNCPYRAKCAETTGNTLTVSLNRCAVGDFVVAAVVTRSDFTVSEGWTVISTSNRFNANQAISWVYKYAESDMETLTVTQTESVRLYINILALSGVAGFVDNGYNYGSTDSTRTVEKPSGKCLWGVTNSYWRSGTKWSCDNGAVPPISLGKQHEGDRCAIFVDDTTEPGQRTFYDDISGYADSRIVGCLTLNYE